MTRPCCVPTRQNLSALQAAGKAAVSHRETVISPRDFVGLEGGAFLMGSDAPEAIPMDREGPVRPVRVEPFQISKYAVTNAQFAAFAVGTGYITDAARLGWSFVFHTHAGGLRAYASVTATPWWLAIEGADWEHPEGPGTSIQDRAERPVVHISYNDAEAFCAWAGCRLPREAEWEYAARGGLEQKTFPWGDELTPGGRHLCNIWQGSFPETDLGEDGFTGPAPVGSFPANAFGLFEMVGNVWEWCADRFDSGGRRVMKGGSYLCHASYCFRYRNAARSSNTLESAACNTGFRVVRAIPAVS